MKKNLTLLFSFFIINNTHAQNTFEKIIDTLGATSAFCVQETFDGGYILCGGSGNNGNDAIAIKLDSAGTIEWAKTYSGPSIEGAYSIEQLPDSGYIMSSIYNNGAPPPDHRHWLLRLDSNGDTLWTKALTPGAGGAEAYRMAQNNGNYGLTGYFKPNGPKPVDAYLIITDSIGTVNASKVYSTSFGSKAFDICKKNQNYILTGAYLPSANLVDLYLVCTDSIGDTLWTKTYDNSQTDVGNAIEQTSDGGFIIAGYTFNSNFGQYNIYLLKTDSLGDSLWTKVYFSAFEEEGHSVEQTTDGGYIIAGITGNGFAGNSDVYLIKTNSTGDTLWTRKFGGSGPDYGYYVRQTKDGGYIISGFGTTPLPGGIYIIKTDSLGHVSTGTGVAEVNNPFVFSVNPNPSSGVFTAQLSGLPYGKAIIEIYNLFNESVYYCMANNHTKQQIDLSHLPNGLYLVMLRTKGKIFTKKIIIQK